MQDGDARRGVRSYVRRQGRMTRGQRRALERYRSSYAVAGEGLLDLDRVFGRHAPRGLEIGFGMGDALLAMAAARPEWDFLGIEVYEPGAGALFARLAERGISNVRVLHGDAMLLLPARIPRDSLDAVYVLFPDPWPKKRHHKRRLIRPEFAALVTERLRPGGRLYLATDWEDYARHMLEVLDGQPGLLNLSGPGRFHPGAAERPATRFERRGERLGHRVRDLVYARRGAAVGGGSAGARLRTLGLF